MPARETNDRAFYRSLRSLRLVIRALELLAPGAVGPLAMLLFRRPRRHREPAREREWLAGAERFDLAVDGRWVAARSWGEGPAVLLVHGWEGRAGQMGAFAAPLAAAGFRAVAIDAPGHGRSEGFFSSLPQFAAAISAAAREVGPLHAAIGHSFGAAGAGWAIHRGLAVRRLVYLAAPWDMQLYIDYFSRLIGLSPRSSSRMLEQFERRLGTVWSEARFATTVGANRTPLLLVHDRQDAETPFAGAARIAAAWPRSALVETEGLGHNGPLRDAAVVERVVGFVAGETRAECSARPQSPDLAQLAGGRGQRLGGR